MNNPLISVIIPTHNSEGFISVAINSVINQTYTNWELIIINDASTDKTSQVIESFVHKDKRIILEDLKENVGGSGARNIGLEKAKGEFITFLDCDDEFILNKLEKFLEFYNSEYKKNSSKDFIVVSDYYEEEGGVLKAVKVLDIPNPIFKLLTMEWHVASGSNIFIPKALLKVIGFFNEKYPRHQDIEFLIRCLQKASVKILHEPLTIIHGHNMEMGPKVNTNSLKIQKIISAKEMLFSDFRVEIDKLDPRDQNRVYAKNWLQVSRLYALDSNWVKTFEFLKMSLNHGVVFSDKIPFIPYITYFVIPIYLLKSSFFKLFKN